MICYLTASITSNYIYEQPLRDADELLCMFGGSSFREMLVSRLLYPLRIFKASQKYACMLTHRP